jgi:hypothetical protein
VGQVLQEPIESQRRALLLLLDHYCASCGNGIGTPVGSTPVGSSRGVS